MEVGHSHINMRNSFGELRQPLQTVKWAARLYAFVFAVVMVNLVIFPLGGAYDPSDFFHTVFKDLPLISLYAFFGIISLFVFVYWLFCTSSGQFVWPTQRRTYARPPRETVLRQALYSTVLACRAPPVSA
ncbi:hypothetical protein ACFQ45_07075 [Rhodanobacter aciditrophus]|uniref:Uncharacterized protein n=1 Tax=Rhodanobacter aciditrophus TaxID=1623218 RepID=A0ABW4AZ96_9GAMM